MFGACLQSMQVRELLWGYLFDLRSKIQHPWLLRSWRGTLMRSCFPLRSSTVTSTREGQTSFLTRLITIILLTLVFKGHPFMWRRTSRNRTKVAKRLDKALADLRWRMTFPDTSFLTYFLPILTIILLVCFFAGLENIEVKKTLPKKRGDRPFRFEDAWASHMLLGD